jgi:FkbM family methyltransferase
MFVSTEGGLRYLRWNLADADPGLLRAARELVTPGAVVWDVGANLGLFSFAAAALAGPKGRVLAVEPDTCLVDLLRRSARLEPGKRATVEVLPVAVSDAVGVGQFHIARRARSANYLESHGTSQTGGPRERQLVMTTTLDLLLDQFPAPDVLKIDVEGAEARVLQGATRILSAVRPHILCETSGRDGELVFHLLKTFHYQTFDADVIPARRTPLQSPAYNILACPSESRLEGAAERAAS